jgi:hypothetical protein
MTCANYDGWVSGACLIEVGREVECVDLDQRMIDALKSGKNLICEAGLYHIVAENMRDWRLARSLPWRFLLSKGYVGNRRDGIRMKPSALARPRLPSMISTNAARAAGDHCLGGCARQARWYSPPDHQAKYSWMTCSMAGYHYQSSAKG